MSQPLFGNNFCNFDRNSTGTITGQSNNAFIEPEGQPKDRLKWKLEKTKIISCYWLSW